MAQPRLNLQFADEDFAAIEAAAKAQKLSVSEWAKSRLRLAAEREGFVTDAELRRTRRPDVG